MSASEIVLCSPVRTAIGAYNGSLKDVPATALGAAVVRETLRRVNRHRSGAPGQKCTTVLI
jgi:acetyl-CoA C-acetyltransferase